MRLGTSLRFLYPTGPDTYEQFRQVLASLPPGGFTERPMGATDTRTQARNVLEIGAAAHEAGMSGLLYGDNHAIAASYANCFSPIPTIGRLMAVTGDLPLGVVLLAPFYSPVLLAEQVGTLAAFAEGPLIVVLVNGGNPGAFRAFGLDMSSRAARTEELATVLRSLLDGEPLTFHGRHLHLDEVRISPLPRVPVEIWIGGTVPTIAERAGRMADGWLSGQNVSDAASVEQLRLYQDAAARHDRPCRPVLRRDIHVADTSQAAHAEVDKILEEGYRGTGKEELLVGSAQEVTERLAHYRHLGFSELMVRHISGDHTKILRSIELIGEQIIPAVADL
jgi:alkanesulfonate monooxygenase SsuD/methylene tetrahydromethanopterin reductase-like flavin-dependent oxidoreductase (luciferase family)